jgi:hypothetical protein
MKIAWAAMLAILRKSNSISNWFGFTVGFKHFE